MEMASWYLRTESAKYHRSHATLRVPVQEVPSPLRENPEVLCSPHEKVSGLWWPGRADDLRPRGPVQGIRVVRYRLPQEVLRPVFFIILGRRREIQRRFHFQERRKTQVRQQEDRIREQENREKIAPLIASACRTPTRSG